MNNCWKKKLKALGQLWTHHSILIKLLGSILNLTRILILMKSTRSWSSSTKSTRIKSNTFSIMVWNSRRKYSFLVVKSLSTISYRSEKNRYSMILRSRSKKWSMSILWSKSSRRSLMTRKKKILLTWWERSIVSKIIIKVDVKN